MSEYGITETGFNRKRLDLLLEELNDEVKSIFGDNLNVAPESPDGQVNGVVSESNANLWELAEQAYNAFNPSAATGVTLSNLVQFNGIGRQEASPSITELTVDGTNGVVILQGSLVSTSDTNSVFVTDEDVTLTGSPITVNATCNVNGPVAAAIGTITNIDTPITGWDSVTNLASAVEGTDEETDIQLRSRRAKSVGRTSQNLISSLAGELLSITGVTQLIILVNDTDSTDANGLDPHSFELAIIGGADQDIAEAIFLKKPVGIGTNGNTTIAVLDSQSISHNMKFERPPQITIYVDVTIDATTDYPVDGDDQIKQNIIDYANGVFQADRGFGLGQDVIYGELYTPINSVTGHTITDLRIATTATPTGTSNIAIALDEVSDFLTVNINVVPA
tara:strand:- start:5841 stop:7016 length:1176 start_codon:yes stop_codon:yes gene_type:complete